MRWSEGLFHLSCGALLIDSSAVVYNSGRLVADRMSNA